MSERDIGGSWLQPFLRHCSTEPDAAAVVALRDDLTVAASLTRTQLLRRANAIAARIVEESTTGDRILLAYENGTEVAAAFLGAVLSGRIPVPAPAPGSSGSTRTSQRLGLIARDAGASLALTTAALLPNEHEAGAFTGRWIATDAEAACPATAVPVAAAAGEIAYLQYTSGSTRTPRGVVLTHAAITSHAEAVIRQQQWDRPGSAALTWLPYFHDYGLIHGIVLPLLAGIPSYLMSPVTFLRRPLRWLDAVGRFRVSHTGAPNFAFDSCVRALQRHSGWQGDLSSLNVASCGAEAIRAGTVRDFCEAFGAYGFRPESFAPGYGLAEATLALTVKAYGEPVKISRFRTESLRTGRAVPADDSSLTELVSNGAPVASDTRLAIVDPGSGDLLPSNCIGEVWAAARSLGSGYWQRPEESQAIFAARLPGDASEYLRTGDLGFLHEGELYITGRLKDVIIVRGRNYYPQDLEWAATNADPALRPGCAAAFPSQRDGTEGAVLVCEVSNPARMNLAALQTAVRGRIAEEFGLELADLVLARPNSIPRTSSGKIQHAACRALYQQGQLKQLSPAPAASGSDAPMADVSRITAIWGEVLDIAEPSPDLQFFAAGGNSLLATQVISRVHATFQVELPIRAVFENPTPALFAACVARLQRGEGQATPTSVMPTLVERPQTVPLSFSQRRMWILHRLEPQSSAYNMPAALRFHGHLDIARLQRAVDALVKRHESLRTVFDFEGDEPTQRIQAPQPLPLQHQDVSSLAPEQRLIAATRMVQASARLPFDLLAGPLLRAVVVRLAPDDHVFMLCAHHIIGDQWSFTVLAQDLAALYAHDAPSLPAQDIHYADYAVWQRRRLTDSRLASQREYWRKQLAGLQPLTLPTDYPATTGARYAGAKVSVPLAPGLLDALESLGARHNATLFMTLLSAFHVLLARHTGQTDIAVGVPIANRRDLAAERLVGTLVNTLVLRLDLSDDPAFATLLDRTRETALEAFANQDMPFEALVEELGGSRDQTSAPLVQVLFNVVNVPVRGVRFDGLEWSLFDFDRGATQFDLALSVDPQLLGTISMEYSIEVFRRDTAALILEHYVELLRSITMNPHQPASRLDMMTATERAFLHGEWQQRPSAYPHEQRTDQLIARQATLAPGSIAISQGRKSIEYADMERAASRLAHELRRQGALPGSRIGVCLERTPRLIVALLAIMKTGAAYVPLDPAYPAERLEYMVEDAGLAFVLIEATTAAILEGHPVRRVDIGAALHASADDPPTGIDAGASPDAAVYVLYTSGSTGRPKGVEVPHRALVNLLWSMRQEPGFKSGDSLLSVTTLSFDIAALEIFLPLICGGHLVLADARTASDGRLLAGELDLHRPTMMQATPSTWTMLLEAGWRGHSGLIALCGGEPLSRALANRLLERCGALWNMYGPTETTVWSLVDRVEAGDGPIAIGRPIANTTLHVLDAHQQPVAPGVQGELYIGGDGVAKGYLGRPELTAQRFVELPGQPAGQRFYRTGDLVRYLPDGRLVHKGRTDDQVKIRGHRIELGEVEARVCAFPGIGRAVAVVREDRQGDPRLVVYYVCEGVRVDPPVLRNHLQLALPRYMVPQHLVVLERLPLLPNGKVDRKGLPPPASTVPTAGQSESRSETEQHLAGVWQELLGVDCIGPHDNFFDLGGHSLLAMKAIAMMEQRTGKSLHARRYIFETFSQIARSYDDASLTGRFRQLRPDGDA